MDIGEAVDVLYLDFEKAFNKVPHKIRAHGVVSMLSKDVQFRSIGCTKLPIASRMGRLDGMTVGNAANLMTVLILCQGKCGLSKGITRYMTAMALGNLMVLIFNVIVSQIVRYHFPTSLLSNLLPQIKGE
eukprot:g44697.t1